jgi:hypothetical protein
MVSVGIAQNYVYSQQPHFCCVWSDYRPARLRFSVISVAPRANAELWTKVQAALNPPPYAVLPVFFFFLNYEWGGTLGIAATTGLLYQPRMIGDGDCGEIGGMKIGKGNRSSRRKPAPAPLCPPQSPHA